MDLYTIVLVKKKLHYCGVVYHGYLSQLADCLWNAEYCFAYNLDHKNCVTSSLFVVTLIKECQHPFQDYNNCRLGAYPE